MQGVQHIQWKMQCWNGESPPTISDGFPVCRASNEECNPGCEVGWTGANCGAAKGFLYESVTADEYVTLL